MKTRRPLSFWQLQLLGWSAFFVTMASSRVGRFPWPFMLASKGAMAVLGFVITSVVVRPIYRRLLRGEPSILRTIVVTAVVSYAVAIPWTALHNIVELALTHAMIDPAVRIGGAWTVIGGTLYDAFALLAWSVLYVAIKHQQALYAERERALRAEALAHESRLEALRFQLNPHFLFNALNAISTLVLEDRRDEAAEMIARLGDLLRATLHRPDGDEVTLESELELVRRYLAIERVRLAERLRVEIDIDRDALAGKVPCLILQPLVENAVRYAVAARPEGGRVSIGARRRNGSLWLAVEDDGPGSPETLNGDGIGLANARARLLHRYGDAQRFRIERSALGGLSVQMELPYRA